MTISYQQVSDFLNESPLFSQLGEGERRRLVKDFDLISLTAGQVLFRQHEQAHTFYIVLQGKLTATAQKNRRVASEVTLQRGDPIGEEAFTRGETYRCSTVATSDAILLRLRADHLQGMIDRYPHLAATRSVLSGTYHLSRFANLDWLNRDERLVMLNRRHPFFLSIRLLVPGLIVLAGLLLFMLNLQARLSFPQQGLIGLAVCMALALCWIFWAAIDWANDYYLLTSSRLVRVDRRLGVFDRRDEIPLGNIMSVEVGTTALGKMFGYGDVTSRTYNTPVLWHGIANPELAAVLIESTVQRVKASHDELEMSAMQAALDRQLDGMETQAGNESSSSVTGDPIITFRKHWVILLRKTWFPSVFGAVSAFILLGGLSARLSEPISDPLKWLTGVNLMIFVIWYLYQFIDWNNDIYQITTDQVMDVKRTPLGREDRKTAMLENILSINYRRRGLLGVLLNYGMVNIQVGTESLIFDYVRDPSGVQREIFRRMAERQAVLRQVNIDAERERMSQWIAAYHRRINE